MLSSQTTELSDTDSVNMADSPKASPDFLGSSQNDVKFAHNICVQIQSLILQLHKHEKL